MLESERKPDDKIGLLVTCGEKVIVNKGVPKETTFDDVRIWYGEVRRTELTGDELKLAVVIGVDITAAGLKWETEVDISTDFREAKAELYKVDCSGGTCEKQVIDTWEPKFMK